jgi:galactokinase
MTGGGFGGCTVSIVKADKVDAFKAAITKAYENETGKTPEFYIADAADGARRL